MQIGMLWQKSDKKQPLVDAIHDAMKHYESKYGERPDVAYVNPKDLDGTEKSCIIRVATNATVIRKHVWLGIERNDALVLRAIKNG